MSEKVRVIVCDKCLRASCWQGVFMCEEANDAGTVEKNPSELRLLELEDPHYWEVPNGEQ